MFVHYPNVTHRILNISPRLILGGGLIFRGAYIWEDILNSVQEAFKVYFVGQERHRTSILYFLNDPNVSQIQVNMKEKILSSQGSFVQRKQIFGNLGA